MEDKVEAAKWMAWLEKEAEGGRWSRPEDLFSCATALSKALRSQPSGVEGALREALEKIKDKWVPALRRDSREADKTFCNAESIFGVVVRALALPSSPAPAQALTEDKFFCEDYLLVDHRNKNPNCLYCLGMDLQNSVRWLKAYDHVQFPVGKDRAALCWAAGMLTPAYRALHGLISAASDCFWARCCCLFTGATYVKK